MLSIIIPDLHGDFDEFCNILYRYEILSTLDKNYINKLGSVNSLKENLNMKNKKIIQLGDILDSHDRQCNNSYTIKYTDMVVFTFICNLKDAFPDQVFLIIGNHELLNCRKIYSYVSPHSQRTSTEYNYIYNNVRRIFQYAYIDENNSLYMHSSIPHDIESINEFKDIDYFIKKNITDLNNREFAILYEYLFDREYAKSSNLNKLDISRVFFGHTPHEYVHIIDGSIFYVDTMISRSFMSLSNYYSCISIDSNNRLSIDLIERYIKYKK